MEEQRTCGKGLAQRSALHEKLGGLITALADNLLAHIPALNERDGASRQERKAYVHLEAQQRRLAADLAILADEMAGYRDLPMGRHDMSVMLGPAPLLAFERYVTRERDLVRFLDQALEQDERMLEEMRAARP